jgi:hypothetical protein
MNWTLTIVVLFATQVINSQPVTIGHESAPVEYYRMPDEPLDPSYKTYSAEISMRSNEWLRTGMTISSLANEYIVLEGYDKVFTNGDVHIEAVIGEFNVYGERRGTQQTKSKDKDGKEITRTTYYLELRYSLPMAFEVHDKKGRVIHDEYIYHITDDQTWRSTNYSSMSELDRYWRSGRNMKLSELQKNRIRQGMSLIRDKINNLFGYQLINETERFEKIGRKKHPLYTGYHTAVETVKKAFKLMDANRDLSEVKKVVQPAIDFYKAQDATCKAIDKETIKLKHIGLYNLALIHFWLEDFDNARNYAEAIYLFDPKDKDAKRLLEEIDYVTHSLHKAKKTSRHLTGINARA